MKFKAKSFLGVFALLLISGCASGGFVQVTTDAQDTPPDVPVDKVPILGDIPVIGILFTSERIE